MNRSTLTLLVASTVLLAGCAQARETVGTVQDCAGLVSDVARTGLQGVPTQAQAKQAAERLDERVRGLNPGAVRDAASALRDRLVELQQAAARTDAAAVRQAANDARDAAAEAAKACSLPTEQFLG